MMFGDGLQIPIIRDILLVAQQEAKVLCSPPVVALSELVSHQDVNV
jgi:hypothetical protein